MVQHLPLLHVVYSDLNLVQLNAKKRFYCGVWYVDFYSFFCIRIKTFEIKQKKIIRIYSNGQLLKLWREMYKSLCGKLASSGADTLSQNLGSTFDEGAWQELQSLLS